MREPITREEALAFLRSVSTCPGATDYGVVFREDGEIDWIFVDERSKAFKLRHRTGGQMFARRLIEEFVPIGESDDA
jgi:hypothetical protein